MTRYHDGSPLYSYLARSGFALFRLHLRRRYGLMRYSLKEADLRCTHVAYPVLHMWPTQCSICGLSSAPYVVYPVPHMWPTQCFICGLPSASYATY